MTTPDLQVLEERLGYKFSDRDLLTRALTHKSHASEARQTRGTELDNEQLEFLGDSVLGFVTSEFLFREYANLDEGRLSMLKARLVSAKHLESAARQIALGDFLMLGRSEEMNHGRNKQRLLANAFEALIAAVYLDGGQHHVSALIQRHLLTSVDPTFDVNYKGALAEKLQRLGFPEPRYTTVATAGPDHARLFTVEVEAGDALRSRAEASSKKAAGHLAAQQLLEQLEAEASLTRSR